jgi:gluconate 5-dehydrogenase
MEEFGRVDILVNNAGAAWGAPALEMPLDAWQKVIDVNLTGVFLFCQAAGRVMRDRGSGSIVNVASVAGLSGTPPEILDSVPYNATKAAVMNLTRDLAVKWAEYGIRVNALAPGWFPTNLTRHFPDDLRDRVIAGVPQRRFGGPDDLKGAAAFLASDASAFVTGHTLVVDGGESICG